MNFPKELKYTKDHEWLRIDGKTAYVGITDFAQGELGDVVYVEVDKVDEELEEGEIMGSIEAVKTVSDVFMPLSGKVLEFNESLEDDAELVNKSPYEDGWIAKIEISDLSQVETLLNVDDYKAIIGQ